MAGMRAAARLAVVAALLGALVGCKSKPRAAQPQPDRNPYREVMPAKVKQKVEDAQKKEETRDDKLIDNAK